MATIITPSQSSESTGNGVVIGILVVVLLAILFLLFGLPYLRERSVTTPVNDGASINVDLPDSRGAGAGTE